MFNLNYQDQLSSATIDLTRHLEARLFPQWDAASRDEFHQRLQNLWENQSVLLSTAHLSNTEFSADSEAVVNYRFEAIEEHGAPCETEFHFVLEVVITHDAMINAKPPVWMAQDKAGESFVTSLKEVETVARALDAQGYLLAVRFIGDLYRHLHDRQGANYELRVVRGEDQFQMRFRFLMTNGLSMSVTFRTAA